MSESEKNRRADGAGGPATALEAVAVEAQEVELAGRKKPERIPELDGLRGLAILSVIVFHYSTGEVIAQPDSFAGWLQRSVVLGWTGVDLFFLLSGFLIGGILMEVRKSDSYFGTFYARRFFRIVPIYYLWITAYVVLVLAAGSWLTAHSFSSRPLTAGFDVFAHYLFLQNLRNFDFPGLKGVWFAALWSLAVEEQFYLFSPLVVRFVSPRRLAACLIAVVCAAPLVRVALVLGSAHATMMPAVLMPCRADSLALGMLMALGWRSPRIREWLGARGGTLYAALIVLGGGMVGLWVFAPHAIDRTMQTIGFTWVALFYGVIMLLALLRRDGPIARVMRVGWLRELGKVSYCMYIIHLVVDLVCHYLLLHEIPRISTARGFAVSALAIFVTYGLAKISWAVLEQPMLRRGHQFEY